MGLIVEINGYKAVGKSTLIAGLKKSFPNAIFREGFRRIKSDLDPSKEQDFYANQRLYIAREIKEFKEFIKSNKLVILLRGPEECGFYATHAPSSVYHENWDSESHLKEELQELSKYKADRILWLDADKDILYKRKANDLTKPRSNMEEWNLRWNPSLGDYIKGLDYTDILNTNNLEKGEVLKYTINWIYNLMDLKHDFVPNRIYIETTNACNARCIMCPHPRMKRKISFMDDETFNKVINDLKQMDLSNSTIFMHKEGEPFLDPKIIDRINDIKSQCHPKEIAINSNGSLLDKEVVDKLVKSGLDTIYLSVDGISKATYERIRVGLCYEEVFNNITNLLKAIKENNSKIHVILQMLIDDENIYEAEKFQNYWGGLGCEVFIKRMHSYLDGGKSSLTTTLSPYQLHACTDPFDMIVVYCDGSVGNCCWDYENTFNIGNIKSESIKDIFNGKKLQNIRKYHSYFACDKLSPCNRCARVFGNDAITGISDGKEIKIQ